MPSLDTTQAKPHLFAPRNLLFSSPSPPIRAAGSPLIRSYRDKEELADERTLVFLSYHEFFDVPNGFLMYHGFLTITTSSRIISRDTACTISFYSFAWKLLELSLDEKICSSGWRGGKARVNGEQTRTDVT
jgi:hypothetical protein